MKRKLAPAAALLAAALLGLTACHGQREQAAFTVPAQFDESRDYEITFWAKNDTNMAQTNIYKQAIEDFQALYPNITVTLRLYTDTAISTTTSSPTSRPPPRPTSASPTRTTSPPT